MPLKDVEREWNENGLIKYMRMVGAQEMGSKKTQIRLATQNRYSLSHALMIGDAPGDMQAAHDNVALFYPINPGHEEASWKQFYEEGLRKFSMGEYAGRYETSLIEEFNALMPDVPPWDKT